MCGSVSGLNKLCHCLVGEFDAAAGEFQSAAFIGHEFAFCEVFDLLMKDFFILGRQFDALGFSKAEVNSFTELLDPVERFGGDQLPGGIDVGALCCVLIGEAAVAVGARA